MSFKHQNGGECNVSELDLHAVPPTQTSGLKSAFTGIETKNSLGFTFTIGKSQEYTDLSENYVHLELEVVKADGGGPLVVDTDVVAPVNNFAHSLFKDVQVTVGGFKISGNTETP